MFSCPIRREKRGAPLFIVIELAASTYRRLRFNVARKLSPISPTTICEYSSQKIKFEVKILLDAYEYSP